MIVAFPETAKHPCLILAIRRRVDDGNVEALFRKEPSTANQEVDIPSDVDPTVILGEVNIPGSTGEQNDACICIIRLNQGEILDNTLPC